MQRDATQRAHAGIYDQVRGRFKRRIRVGQIKLHAETIPEAVKARQDLKSKIAKGAS